MIKSIHQVEYWDNGTRLYSIFYSTRAKAENVLAKYGYKFHHISIPGKIDMWRKGDSGMTIAFLSIEELN